MNLHFEWLTTSLVFSSSNLLICLQAVVNYGPNGAISSHPAKLFNIITFIEYHFLCPCHKKMSLSFHPDHSLFPLILRDLITHLRASLCLLLSSAGVWCAAPEPNGADGEDLGEEQEETPQDEREHQEETVGAGFQHLQRLLQCVWALLPERRYKHTLAP